ncbi:hypothetical protein G6F31_016843 [Rhizopus arrhizus]|nr:hypothetical protein G6F31_016843 [Rhizopus arrhizus]
MAADTMSMRLEVSEPISAENAMGSICTSNPASLPTAFTMSTITPSMLLVLVSRKVKGLPVGVDPTFNTVWACAPAAMDNAANTETPRVLNFMTYPHRGKEDRTTRGVPGGATIP